jgi:hypothetical protein
MLPRARSDEYSLVLHRAMRRSHLLIHADSQLRNTRHSRGGSSRRSARRRSPPISPTCRARARMSCSTRPRSGPSSKARCRSTTIMPRPAPGLRSPSRFPAAPLRMPNASSSRGHHQRVLATRKFPLGNPPSHRIPKPFDRFLLFGHWPKTRFGSRCRRGLPNAVQLRPGADVDPEDPRSLLVATCQ